MVMPTNNCKAEVHYWQGLHGGLGHLYGPEKGARRGPYAHLPYALDNGAYAAWTEQRDWDAAAYCDLLEWAREAKEPPLWAVVPDVVTNPTETVAQWDYWSPRLRQRYDFPLALAVQDGMRPDHVRELAEQPDVIFVGGSTKWKWSTMSWWTDHFARVHVGRVNSPDRLYLCAQLGAESVDGTGWFRGDAVQTAGLEEFLRRQKAGEVRAGYLERYGGLFEDIDPCGEDRPRYPTRDVKPSKPSVSELDYDEVLGLRGGDARSQG